MEDAAERAHALRQLEEVARLLRDAHVQAGDDDLPTQHAQDGRHVGVGKQPCASLCCPGHISCYICALGVQDTGQHHAWDMLDW